MAQRIAAVSQLCLFFLLCSALGGTPARAFDVKDLEAEKHNPPPPGTLESSTSTEVPFYLDIKAQHYNQMLGKTYVIFGKVQNDKIIIFNKPHYLTPQGASSSASVSVSASSNPLPMASTPMTAKFVLLNGELSQCQVNHRFKNFLAEVSAIPDHIGLFTVEFPKGASACAEQMKTILQKIGAVQTNQAPSDVNFLTVKAPLYLEPLNSDEKKRLLQAEAGSGGGVGANGSSVAQELRIDGQVVDVRADGSFVKSFDTKFPVSVSYKNSFGAIELQGVDPSVMFTGRNNTIVDYAQFLQVGPSIGDQITLVAIPPPPPWRIRFGISPRVMLVNSDALSNSVQGVFQPIGFTAMMDHPKHLSSILQATFPYPALFSGIGMGVIQIDYTGRYKLSAEDSPLEWFALGGLFIHQLQASPPLSAATQATTPVLTNFMDYTLGVGVRRNVGKDFVATGSFKLSPFGAQSSNGVVVKFSSFLEGDLMWPLNPDHDFMVSAQFQRLVAPLSQGGETSLSVIGLTATYLWHF